jgi:hypothetical protein
MTYRIDPDAYCTADGCTRPKATGEQTCSQCLRLAGAAGHPESDGEGASPSEPSVQARELLAGEPRLPRCIAYLSRAGDVITLELTGEPKFTEADVVAAAAALSNRKRAA